MIELRDRLTDRVVDAYPNVAMAAAAYCASEREVAQSVDYPYLPMRDWYYWTDGRSKNPRSGYKRGIIVSDGEKLLAYSSPNDFLYQYRVTRNAWAGWAKRGRVPFVRDGVSYEAAILANPIANDARVVRVGGTNRWGIQPLI